MPHLDAAYNLARWLTRNPADAADVVQESVVRALRFIDGYRGSNAKAWLLTIVRNTCLNWLKANRGLEPIGGLDDCGSDGELALLMSREPDPETRLIKRSEASRIDRLILALAPEFRECIILRELEELSYREIAAVTGVPIGTVMSRLSRARRLIQRAWLEEEALEAGGNRT